MYFPALSAERTKKHRTYLFPEPNPYYISTKKKKKLGSLGEMGDLGAGEGQVQNEPGICFKKKKKKEKYGADMTQEHSD